MTDLKKTERGFNIFGQWDRPDNGWLSVTESSRALEGPHVWIQIGGYRDDDGRPYSTTMLHLNIHEARNVVKALTQFIEMAERDELTEPLEWTKEVALKRGFKEEDLEDDDDE